jgi:hypothetical protein
MNRAHFFMSMIVVFLMQSVAFAQSQEVPKFEVAAEFTTLERDRFSERTEPGFGGRFTYNLNRVFSLEAAGYFFPKRCFDCSNNGQMTEVVGGVKVGKRFGSWGLFGKARPGFVRFSEGEVNVIPDPTIPGFPFRFEFNPLTAFATDLGGVLEFYPSKRIVTRFDAGDTIIHFNRRTFPGFRFDPVTQTYTVVPFPIPARTTHHFQFMASVGFRF